MQVSPSFRSTRFPCQCGSEQPNTEPRHGCADVRHRTEQLEFEQCSQARSIRQESGPNTPAGTRIQTSFAERIYMLRAHVPAALVYLYMHVPRVACCRPVAWRHGSLHAPEHEHEQQLYAARMASARQPQWARHVTKQYPTAPACPARFSKPAGLRDWEGKKPWMSLRVAETGHVTVRADGSTPDDLGSAQSRCYLLGCWLRWAFPPRPVSSPPCASAFNCRRCRLGIAGRLCIHLHPSQGLRWSSPPLLFDRTRRPGGLRHGGQQEYFFFVRATRELFRSVGAWASHRLLFCLSQV
jgi:hypothetical protein